MGLELEYDVGQTDKFEM